MKFLAPLVALLLAGFSLSATTVTGLVVNITGSAFTTNILFTPSPLPGTSGGAFVVGSSKLIVATNGVFSTDLVGGRYNVRISPRDPFIIWVPTSGTYALTQLYKDANGGVVPGDAPFLPVTGGDLSGNLRFSGALSGGVVPPYLSTAQRDALNVVSNGMVIWNVSLAQSQVYQSGAWTNLVASGGGSGTTLTNANTTGTQLLTNSSIKVITSSDASVTITDNGLSVNLSTGTNSGITSATASNIVAGMTGPSGSNFVTSARLAGSNYLQTTMMNDVNGALFWLTNLARVNSQMLSVDYDGPTFPYSGLLTFSIQRTNVWMVQSTTSADGAIDPSQSLVFSRRNLGVTPTVVLQLSSSNIYMSQRLTASNGVRLAGITNATAANYLGQLSDGTVVQSTIPTPVTTNGFASETTLNSFSVANSNLSYAIGANATNYAYTKQFGSAILTNLSGTGAMTNGIVAGGQVILTTNASGQTVVTASTNITTLAAGSATLGSLSVTGQIVSGSVVTTPGGISSPNFTASVDPSSRIVFVDRDPASGQTLYLYNTNQVLHFYNDLLFADIAFISQGSNYFLGPVRSETKMLAPSMTANGSGTFGFESRLNAGTGNRYFRAVNTASGGKTWDMAIQSSDNALLLYNDTDSMVGLTIATNGNATVAGGLTVTNAGSFGSLTNTGTLTANSLGSNAVVSLIGKTASGQLVETANGVDPAFIRGLLVTKSGSAAIAVSAGSWYHNVSNRVYSLPASTLSLTVSASTLYSVYASVSNSLPVLEAFAENPPTTNYFGSARQRATGTLGRWIGHFITDSGSIIAPTGTKEAGANSVSVMYQTPGTILNRILSAGAATGLTVITADAICPKYASTEMWSLFQFTYTTNALAPILINTSLDGTNVIAGFSGYCGVANNFVASSSWHPLSTNNTIYYKNTTTSPGTGLVTYVDVYGVKYAR